MKTMLAIRLPDDITDRLNALAKRTGRSKTFYAREAILRHLEDMEDTFLATDRFKNTDRRWTQEEIEQEVETNKTPDIWDRSNHNNPMKKKKNLIFTSGSLATEDKEWDRAFWKLATTDQKFLATSELIRFAHEIKSNTKLSMQIDKLVFESGTYRD